MGDKDENDGHHSSQKPVQPSQPSSIPIGGIIDTKPTETSSSTTQSDHQSVQLHPGNASNPSPTADSSSLPNLPPKTFESYPTIIASAPSHSKPSNRTLIKFFLSLSNLIFFGGSIAGAIVVIYQRYMFPKLKIRTERLKLLNFSTFASFEKFTKILQSLVRSNPDFYQSSIRKIPGDNKPEPNLDQVVNDLSENANENNSGNPLDAQNDEKLSHKLNSTLNKVNLPIPSSSPGEESKKEGRQTPKNIKFDPNVTIIDSEFSTLSSRSLENESEPASDQQLRESIRKDYNQPIINRLESIASNFNKREKNRISLKGLVETNCAHYSIAPETDTSQTNGMSRGIETLKNSLKLMGDEINDECQQISLIDPKYYRSQFHSYGSSYLGSNSPFRESIKDDEYQNALKEFRTEIRNLKGILLNRKKFY